RLAANSLATAQVWLATILGPVMAGLFLVKIAPAWLLAFDAASFVFLGGQAWRTHTAAPTTDQPREAQAAESGFRLLRRHGLIVLTWFFFFLYGPVEDALPATSPTTCTRTRDSSAPTGRASVSAHWSRPSSQERSAGARRVGSRS